MEKGMAQVQPQNKEALPITVTFLNLLTFLLKSKKITKLDVSKNLSNSEF